MLNTPTRSNEMKVSQRDAVFSAVTNVCGTSDGAYMPTKEQRSSVNQILFEGFRSGTIECSREYDDAELKAYVSGLQSNWLRKDTRLNGGVKYQAKNPGSRAGSQDAQIVAMRSLLKVYESDAAKTAEIQAHIAKRLAEIKPTKTVTIDVEALPEELRHLASN
jgi:hypothetical protein